jgi:ACDE family multidrug resistance protein
MSAVTHRRGAAHGQAVSPFRQPKAVFAVAFACVVSFMGIGLVDPILPAISNQLHASPSETTLLFTSYLVVTAVAMLITNWVSSRIGAKWTMIAGLVLIVTFAGLAGSSGSIREIIEFRAGWGIGNALFIATSLAVIVASASGGFAGAIVLYETALGLGIAVGPLLGGTLGEISWRGPFYGVSVLMAISLLATVVLVDKTPKPPAKTSLSAPFKALRHRGLLTMALTALCYNWGFFTILGYAPFPMELSPIKLGLVFCGWGIMVAVFAVFGAPWLQRRLGIAATMYANLFIFALITLGIAIWTLDKTALIVLVIVSGIVCGVNNTVTTQAVMTVSPVERPVASAAYSFVRFIGGGLAPYVAGRLVVDYNIHLPFYIGAGAILLGIGILASGHKLLDQAERAQAASAEAALAHGPSSPEAAAERELESEETADALLGDAD